MRSAFSGEASRRRWFAAESNGWQAGARHEVAHAEQVRLPHDRDNEPVGMIGRELLHGARDHRVAVGEASARGGFEREHGHLVAGRERQQAAIEPHVEVQIVEPRAGPTFAHGGAQLREGHLLLEELLDGRFVLRADGFECEREANAAVQQVGEQLALQCVQARTAMLVAEPEHACSLQFTG